MQFFDIRSESPFWATLGGNFLDISSIVGSSIVGRSIVGRSIVGSSIVGSLIVGSSLVLVV